MVTETMRWYVRPDITGEPWLVSRSKKGALSAFYEHFGVVFSSNGMTPGPNDPVFELQTDGHAPLTWEEFRNGEAGKLYGDCLPKDSKADVIARLNEFFINPKQYHIKDFNCETFGTYIMTGEGISRQASNTTAIVLTSFGIGFVAALLMPDKPKSKRMKQPKSRVASRQRRR